MIRKINLKNSVTNFLRPRLIIKYSIFEISHI